MGGMLSIRYLHKVVLSTLVGLYYYKCDLNLSIYIYMDKCVGAGTSYMFLFMYGMSIGVLYYLCSSPPPHIS